MCISFKILLNHTAIILLGLILVSEPYYNEAGFEKQRGSVIGLENSKMYNEMAIIKLVQVRESSVMEYMSIVNFYPVPLWVKVLLVKVQ